MRKYDEHNTTKITLLWTSCTILRSCSVYSYWDTRSRMVETVHIFLKEWARVPPPFLLQDREVTAICNIRFVHLTRSWIGISSQISHYQRASRSLFDFIYTPLSAAADNWFMLYYISTNNIDRIGHFFVCDLAPPSPSSINIYLHNIVWPHHNPYSQTCPLHILS